MKISCFKTDLLNGINIANRAVATRTTLPVLECFLIDATDSGIKIITNNNDMAIETEVSGSIEKPGKVVIDARIFSDIIRKLPDNVVIIEGDALHKIKINCENSEFNIKGHDPLEFPEIPKTEEDKKIEISEFSLKELIRQTIFSVAVNDANAIMCGECLEISGNIIKLTSLDGHRISIKKEILESSYGNEKVIIPGKVLKEVSVIINGEVDQKVNIYLDRTFIKFEFGHTTVVSRLIEGEYFNVERMISKDYETDILINKKDLFNEIDRASSLTREVEKKPIIMEINDSNMFLELSSSLGTMYGRVDISKSGKDLTIGFNPRFFTEALKVIDDEEINIHFIDSISPCFIKNAEETYMYIILPVNINRD